MLEAIHAHTGLGVAHLNCSGVIATKTCSTRDGRTETRSDLVEDFPAGGRSHHVVQTVALSRQAQSRPGYITVG